MIRFWPRIAVLSLLVFAAPALSGCANFDPDSLDIFGLNEKKKLPGERRDVFPEGVPGVSQGIPPEYLKSNQPAADAATTPLPGAQAASQPAAAPAEPEPPKPKPKRTAKRTAPKPAATDAAPVAPVQSQDMPADAAPAAPPAPAQGAPANAAWPAPLPSGTLQR